MKINLAVLADHASVDAQGKLNIMGIFDTIFASAVPAQHPTMMLVLRYAARPSELGREQTITIRMADEDGAKMFEVSGKVTPQPPPNPPRGADTTINHILVLQNAVFPRYGAYSFNILIGNNEVDSVVLHVRPLPSASTG